MALTADQQLPTSSKYNYLEFNFSSKPEDVKKTGPLSKRGGLNPQFTPRENKLFDNLQKYNNSTTGAPLSIGNPLVIRAVVSKLDYNEEAYSFVNKERVEESRNIATIK